MEYSVIALVLLVVLALIVMYVRTNDGFSPYYELPRRDPQQFVRHPLEFQK